jgi:hypothetical protein
MLMDNKKYKKTNKVRSELLLLTLNGIKDKNLKQNTKINSKDINDHIKSFENIVICLKEECYGYNSLFNSFFNNLNESKYLSMNNSTIMPNFIRKGRGLSRLSNQKTTKFTRRQTLKTLKQFTNIYHEKIIGRNIKKEEVDDITKGFMYLRNIANSFKKSKQIETVEKITLEKLDIASPKIFRNQLQMLSTKKRKTACDILETNFKLDSYNENSSERNSREIDSNAIKLDKSRSILNSLNKLKRNTELIQDNRFLNLENLSRFRKTKLNFTKEITELNETENKSQSIFLTNRKSTNKFNNNEFNSENNILDSYGTFDNNNNFKSIRKESTQYNLSDNFYTNSVLNTDENNNKLYLDFNTDEDYHYQQTEEISSKQNNNDEDDNDSAASFNSSSDGSYTSYILTQSNNDKNIDSNRNLNDSIITKDNNTLGSFSIFLHKCNK